MSTKSRLRVLFVIGTMGGGGAERQVLEILKRLNRARFEPILYLATKQGELLSKVPCDVPIFAFWDGQPETASRTLLRQAKLTRFVRYAHLAQVLREQKIDLVYDRTYLSTLDAAGGCFLRPTPRISCCVVDPEPELKLYARWSTKASWWFARRAYLSASVVLANSEGLRQRVIDYFQLKPDHVKVLHNLLPAASVGSTDAAHSQAFVKPREPFVIVTAGRLHPQKGHLFLLAAVEKLVHQQRRSILLYIFGKGESETTLQEFVRSHQLEEHVILAGFVSDPRRQYRQADLFVLPSLYEGMPNALIEAVTMEIPVIATDCLSGPSEILDGGRCGRLVPPGDASALAIAIAEVIDHPEISQRLTATAKLRVEELFDPEKGIHRLEQLIEQVANHPKA